MLTRCNNCGGKFDKDEAYEMDHCGGIYEEICEYCVEMLEEEREEREWRAWQDQVREWDKEDSLIPEDDEEVAGAKGEGYTGT
jgi:transcription initiation factor IIE alpha subunit